MKRQRAGNESGKTAIARDIPVVVNTNHAMECRRNQIVVVLNQMPAADIEALRD